MALEEFYAAVGGDLEDVRGRMQSDERVEKFARLFLMDDAYPLLISSHESGDLPTEFRAAHTLKGTSRDMGFMRLFEPANKLADALRPGEDGNPAAPHLAPELLEQVTAAYEELQAAAETYL